MKPVPDMPDFNANQKAKLMVSFRHLDDLLGSALDKLAGAKDALFTRYQPDVTPVQRKLLGDYLAQLRHVMRRFLDAHDMGIERPHTGAAWAFRTALVMAQNTLDELRPKNLRGYGELAAEGEHQVSVLLAELGAILGQMDAFLARQGDADFGARLARLAVDGKQTAALRELTEIVTRYGLVEFRATLMWLLERMEAPGLEVAFFGRVSSGKSSLVNWFLETGALPTGVTPVTTVPTRIVAGDTPRATIYFAGEKAITTGLDRLTEFVSEEDNPDNGKKVVKVIVEFPSPRLRRGVCLVDTPGLGSLATAGAAETLTYLPRCDIGVLLVDAASGLDEEDIAVARSLRLAGADLLALLSRADLLSPADREKMLGYVRAKLGDKLGEEVPVWPVSVKGESRALAQHWLDEALAPRLERQRELAAASLRRKIIGLRDAVAATLQQLAAAPRQRGQDAEQLAAAHETGEARAAIEAARSAVRNWSDTRRERINALLDVAATSVAQAWAGNNETTALPDTAALVLAGSIRVWANARAAELAEVHARIARSLAALGHFLAAASELSELPRPSSQPLFDATGLAKGLDLRRSIAASLGSGVRQRLAREQLERQLAAPLELVLSTYERMLQTWGQDYLAQLEHAFAAAASPVEAGLRGGAKAWDAELLARDIAQLNEMRDPEID